MKQAIGVETGGLESAYARKTNEDSGRAQNRVGHNGLSGETGERGSLSFNGLLVGNRN